MKETNITEFDAVCYQCGTTYLGPLIPEGDDKASYGTCPGCGKEQVTLFSPRDFDHMKVTAEGGSEK